MENSYIGNPLNDITAEETPAPLRLDGTTHPHENSPARKQYTGNGRSGRTHPRMPQHAIEAVYHPNGLSPQNRAPVIQALAEMMKLQQCGKGLIIHPPVSLSPWAKQGGKWRGIGYSREWGQAFTRQNNRQQQQPRPNGQIPPRQGGKAGPPNICCRPI